MMRPRTRTPLKTEHPWEKKNKVLDLWQKGVPAAEIGVQLNMTKNAVIGLVRRLRDSGEPRAVPRTFNSKGGVPKDPNDLLSNVVTLPLGDRKKKNRDHNAPKQVSVPVARPKIPPIMRGANVPKRKRNPGSFTLPEGPRIVSAKDRSERKSADRKKAEKELQTFEIVAEREVKTVLNIKHHECRWVLDKITDTMLRVFCGEPVTDAARPYCKTHYGLVYVSVRNQ